MNNKCVLITGASRGIGRAIALAFAREGYNVGINYINNHTAATYCLNEVSGFGVDAEIFKCDVSDSNNAEKLISDFIARFGKVDVLINNAGVSKIAPIQNITSDDWSNIINTNLSSAFFLSQAVLHYFLRQGYGNIINISSIWGKTGASCEVAYSASKSGLIGLTKALAKELGQSNIRVNSISPGLINTDMNCELSQETLDSIVSETPLSRIGNPEDVAKIALFLASDRSEFITGADIPVNGGLLI